MLRLPSAVRPVAIDQYLRRLWHADRPARCGAAPCAGAASTSIELGGRAGGSGSAVVGAGETVFVAQRRVLGLDAGSAERLMELEIDLEHDEVIPVAANPAWKRMTTC